VRKLTFFASFVVFLTNATFVLQANAQSPMSVAKDSRWTVEFGAKAYDRPGDDLALPLITDEITLAPLFDSTQASDLGNTVGAEVKFSFVTPRGKELEIRSILASWDEAYQFEGDNLQSPFFPSPELRPTTVNYDYESDYFSIEVMKRRDISRGITLMFGPRFVSTRDRVKLGGSISVNPGDGTTVDFTQTQTTEATNALIGLQTGLEFDVPMNRYIHFNSFIRAGGYMNPTEVTTSVSDTVSTISTQTSQTKSTCSFLGEVGGRLYVDIVPNCVSSYVGYEATWIDGMALAPAQLLTTGSTGVETGNTPFFHAIAFGLNFNY
jgi:hypothetical protein